MSQATSLTAQRANNTFSVGLVIAFASWALVFITLIWGYVVFRLRSASWFEQYLSADVVWLAIANTFLMVASSRIFSEALKASAQQGRRWLVAAFILGFGFCVGQVLLWRLVFMQGLDWHQTQAGSFFYVLTGFHALHMVGGLIALAVLGFRFKDMQGSMAAYGIKYFWDFLLVVWLVLFVLIFIVR